MSLDNFFPSTNNKHTAPGQRCANPKCRRIIKDVKYTLIIKGKENVYCQACAKQILSPQEDVKEAI